MTIARRRARLRRLETQLVAGLDSLRAELAELDAEVAEVLAEERRARRKAEADAERARRQAVSAKSRAERRQAAQRRQRTADAEAKRAEVDRRNKDVAAGIADAVAAAANELLGTSIRGRVLLERGASGRVADARRVLIWLLIERRSLNYSQVARCLGRDHTTIRAHHLRPLTIDQATVLRSVLSRLAASAREQLAEEPDSVGGTVGVEVGGGLARVVE